MLALGLPEGATAEPGVAAEVDSDGDGLPDFQEVHKYRTDPKKADSDGDGRPDGEGEERREFTYSIRCVVEHMPPADAVSDDWQDARVLKRDGDAVRLEIVAYPLSTGDADIPDDPGWRAASVGFPESTQPTLTCDFDDSMTKELVSALRLDGIDPQALGDRELVRKVASWAFRTSRSVTLGFSTYCVTARDGRLAVEPGLEAYMTGACATVPRTDDGKPPGIEEKRSLEQQLDAEVRGRAMFRRRIHGSCTSSAVYLQTILRALGLPTRTTVAMPPADGADDAQVAMLRQGLRPSALRDAILAGPQRGWAEHTFNVVRVGGRWRRLNYSTLGQPIVDRDYLGLVLRILDYDDLATSGVSATWGRKWALGERSPRFPYGNPYRLIEVSDLLGVHATVTLPPPAPPPAAETAADAAAGTLTITAATWTPDAPDELLRLLGADPLELTIAGSVDGESYAPYKRFAEKADVRFVLRARGFPDVPASYKGFTKRRPGGQRLILATSRQALREGVAYTLVPLNEMGTHRWLVADGVTISR